MEKLQAAINKARQQRHKKEQAFVLRDPIEVSSPDEGAWKELPEIEIDLLKTRRHRLVARVGGHDALPHDMLRTRILQIAGHKGWRRVALVSPHQGAGKTTTAANLAFSFGRQTDRRTMVLDFDLRRIGLASILGLKPNQNMSDVLSGKIPFSEHGVRLGDNVVLGLNNKPVRNPSEILQSHKTQEVLGEIEAYYQPDIILFDMPPLLATDDSVGFLKNVDCALLMAEVGATTIEQIDVTERQISELTNVMGVILNKTHSFDSGYGYNYDANPVASA